MVCVLDAVCGVLVVVVMFLNELWVGLMQLLVLPPSDLAAAPPSAGLRGVVLFAGLLPSVAVLPARYADVANLPLLAAAERADPATRFPPTAAVPTPAAAVPDVPAAAAVPAYAAAASDVAASPAADPAAAAYAVAAFPAAGPDAAASDAADSAAAAYAAHAAVQRFFFSWTAPPRDCRYSLATPSGTKVGIHLVVAVESLRGEEGLRRGLVPFALPASQHLRLGS